MNSMIFRKKDKPEKRRWNQIQAQEQGVEDIQKQRKAHTPDTPDPESFIDQQLRRLNEEGQGPDEQS